MYFSYVNCKNLKKYPQGRIQDFGRGGSYLFRSGGGHFHFANIFSNFPIMTGLSAAFEKWSGLKT